MASDTKPESAEPASAPATRPRRKRRLRRFIRRLLLVLFLLVAAVLILLPWIIPQGFLQNKIKEAVRAQLGRECEMERAELSVWSGLVIENFRLKERPGFGEQSTVTIARLQGKLHWAWLVHWQFAPTVRLHDVEVNVVGNAEGKLNLQDVLDRFLSQLPPPGLRMSVDGGRVYVRDMRRERPLVLTLVSMELTPVRGAGTITYDMEVVLRRLQKTGAGDIQLSTRVELNPTDPQRAFFRGDVRVDGLDVTVLPLPKDVPARPVSGRVSLEQSFQVEGDRFRIPEGTLTLTDVMVKAPALSSEPLAVLPVRVSYEAEGNFPLGQLSLRKAKIVPVTGTVAGPGAFIVDLQAEVRDLWTTPEFDVTIRPRADLGLLFGNKQDQMARSLRDLLRREMRGEGQLIKRLKLKPEQRERLRATLGMLADSLPVSPTVGLFGGVLRAAMSDGELRVRGEIGWKEIAILPSLDGTGTLPGMTLNFAAVVTPTDGVVRLTDFSVDSLLTKVRGSGRFHPGSGPQASGAARTPPTVTLNLQGDVDLARLEPNLPEGIVYRIFTRNIARKLSADPERYLGPMSLDVRRFLARLPDHMKRLEKVRTRGRLKTGVTVDGPLDRLTLSGFVDGTSLDIHDPKVLHKKSEDPMRLDFSAVASPERVTVSLPVITLLRLNATARATYRKSKDAADVHFAVTDFAGFSPVEILEMDGVPDVHLVGGIRVDVQLTELHGQTKAEGTLRLGNLSVMDAKNPDRPRITLHGAFDFSPHTVKTRYPLVLLVANSVGLLEFEARDVLKDDALATLLDFDRKESLDVNELVDRPTITFRVSSPSLDMRPLEQPDAAPPKVPEGLSSLHEVIKRTEINGTVNIASLISSGDNLTDVDGILVMKRDEGIFRLARFRWHYAGGRMVYDGTSLDLLKDPIEFYLYNRIENVGPTPTVSAMVARQFPGLTFEQRLSMITNMRGRLHNDPVKLQASLSGSGSTSIHGGTLRGKSLPDYIGNFFPGLKYSNYKFKKMENHVYNVRGVAYNDMFFHGTPVDVFVVGRTEPTGQIDYTMGVDFSGERRHRLLNPLLLRVPLMRYTGRIVGKEFEDESIFFVPPNEVATLLVTKGIHRFLAKGPIDWTLLEKWHVPGHEVTQKVLDAIWVPGWFFRQRRP